MWHPNGQLSYESKGIADGEYAAYYPDGQLKFHGKLKDGKRTGTRTDYTPDGEVDSLTTYDEHGMFESRTVDEKEGE